MSPKPEQNGYIQSLHERSKMIITNRQNQKPESRKKVIDRQIDIQRKIIHTKAQKEK